MLTRTLLRHGLLCGAVGCAALVATDSMTAQAPPAAPPSANATPPVGVPGVNVLVAPAGQPVPVPASRSLNAYIYQDGMVRHTVTAASAGRTAEISRVMAEFAAAEFDEDKARVKESLKKLVVEEFDERQQARETQLKEMETELARLRKLHDERARARDNIVDARVLDLLRTASGLGWDLPEEERRANNRYGVEFLPNILKPGVPATIPALPPAIPQPNATPQPK
jgi:hypothetical protein